MEGTGYVICLSYGQFFVYMSLVVRKPVIGVCDQGRLQPAQLQKLGSGLTFRI